MMIGSKFQLTFEQLNDKFPWKYSGRNEGGCFAPYAARETLKIFKLIINGFAFPKRTDFLEIHIKV